MLFDIEGWPLLLLGLRITAVVLLYGFLITAVRVLLVELSAMRVPPVEPHAVARRQAQIDPGREVGTREVHPRRRSPAGAVIVFAVTSLVIVLAGTLVALGDSIRSGGNPASDESGAKLGPPAVMPASSQVTVGLAATTDLQLRVTVDGTVKFEGMLAAGERQAWEGSERIQVWTDRGKDLLLAVNGHDLGPYSPAMGHPDWNRIDFGFWPGWTP